LFYVFLGAGGNKKGGGSANTISSGHREQLNKLMNTLDANSPHFVRYKKTLDLTSNNIKKNILL
jgi:hypothetical protein